MAYRRSRLGIYLATGGSYIEGGLWQRGQWERGSTNRIKGQLWNNRQREPIGEMAKGISQ